jgi:hypothetical protein
MLVCCDGPRKKFAWYLKFCLFEFSVLASLVFEAWSAGVLDEACLTLTPQWTARAIQFGAFSSTYMERVAWV